MAPFISRPARQRPSQDDRRQARWHNHIPRPGARSLSKMGLSALLWRSRQNERVCASFFLTPLLVKVDGRHHWETALCDVFPPACSGLCLSFLWSLWKASRTDHGWRWCNPLVRQGVPPTRAATSRSMERGGSENARKRAPIRIEEKRAWATISLSSRLSFPCCCASSRNTSSKVIT